MAHAVPADPHFSIAHYWQQGDAASHAVAYLLLAMSLASWFFIFSKAYSSWRIRRAAPALDAFWAAPSMVDGIAVLSVLDTEAVFAPLPAHGLAHADATHSLGGQVSRGDQITRVLRQQITRSTQRIESGLTVLASIGATAPFVGLLGTVWGIYHALANVAAAGTIRVDKLAGPVGEALVMTGLGLAVAIPAVLAYNGFNRLNRITLAELDGFAHDLHAFFVRGGADHGVRQL
jgi:biopolymer transport protein ExbB